MIADTAWLGLGMAAAVLHFGLLRWNTALYARPGGLVSGIGLQAARMVALAGVLYAIALHGAVPLLLATLGLLLARPFVLRLGRGGAA